VSTSIKEELFVKEKHVLLSSLAEGRKKCKKEWVIFIMAIYCFSTGWDVAVFGGTTLNKASGSTFGGTMGMLAFAEGEIGTVGRMTNANINLRLLVGLPEVEDMWFGPYVIGGGGKVGDNAAFNIGGGSWVAPWRLHESWKKSSPVIRLDYRYFGVKDDENFHRVSIGVWFSSYGPLFTD
jgi:hypothetical protein